MHLDMSFVWPTIAPPKKPSFDPKLRIGSASTSLRGKLPRVDRIFGTLIPEDVAIEIDHILEIQFFEACMSTTYDRMLMTQSQCVLYRDWIKNAANHPSMMNCTTHTVNQAKRGPFTSWRNRYLKSQTITMAECAAKSSSACVKALLAEDRWNMLEQGLLDHWEYIAEPLLRANEPSDPLAPLVLDSISLGIMSMYLTSSKIPPIPDG